MLLRYNVLHFMGYKVNISKETPKMPKSCSKNGQKIGFLEQKQISGLKSGSLTVSFQALSPVNLRSHFMPYF